MKPRVAFVFIITVILSVFVLFTSAGPVSRAEVETYSMKTVPQWHCLRYFKHDIHLLRRCRNHRFHGRIRK